MSSASKSVRLPLNALVGAFFIGVSLSHASAEEPKRVAPEVVPTPGEKTEDKERVVSMIREERMLFVKFPVADLEYWKGRSGVDLLPKWRLRGVQILEVKGEEVFAIFVAEPKGDGGFQASAKPTS